MTESARPKPNIAGLAAKYPGDRWIERNLAVVYARWYCHRRGRSKFTVAPGRAMASGKP
jgi:hypothetical protein